MAQHSWFILQQCPGGLCLPTVFCAQRTAPRDSPGSATSRDNRPNSIAGSLSSYWGSSCCGPSQATAPYWVMGCPHRTDTNSSRHKQLGKVTTPLVCSNLERAQPGQGSHLGVPHCPWMLSQQEGPNSISETNPWLKEGGWSSRKSLPDCHS